MIIPLNNGITTSILDPDARDFIRLTQVTDEIQIRAVNELCIDLKREGFWNRIYRLYPFVYTGSNASMLIELKMRKNNLAINFSSFTFSNMGVEFGLSSSLTQNNLPFWTVSGGISSPDVYSGGHMAIYNNKVTSTSSTQYHMHYQTGGVASHVGFKFISSTKTVQANMFNREYTFASFTYSGDDTGLFLYSNDKDYGQNSGGVSASTTNPWTFYLSKNGQVLGTYSATYSRVPYPAMKFTLGRESGQNIIVNSYQSYQRICWLSFGSGDFYQTGTNNEQQGFQGKQINIGDQEKFYQIVQKFQTALGRQV